MRYRPASRSIEFGLLAFPALVACIGMITIVLVPAGRVTWTWADIWVSLVFAAVVLGMSVSFSLARFRGDQVVLPITAMLAVIGLLLLQRLHPDLAAIDPDRARIAQRQFIYLMAGMATLWIVVALSGPLNVISWLRKYRNTWLIVSLMLQAATFVIGTGPPGSGAKLWISAGPIQIQPSEIVKITLVIYLASYLDDYRDLIGFSWRIWNFELPPIPYLAPMVLMWLASLLTLVILNDLGSALLFFAVFLSMLYFASGRRVYVAIGSVAFVSACVAAYLAFDRVGIRVQNWLDPWQDPFQTGYQPIQSEYALANGGILGTGLAQGSPWLIPAVETDYIFSAIGEELGLLGTLAILTLYFMLVVRGYIVALRARDGFVQLLAAGLTSIIAFQVIIIIGGVIRLIPLTGITLPFISYGGSSLLTNLGLIGLLLHLSSQPRRNDLAR